MCTSEKKFININNLMSEIRKVKRTDKYIALTDSKKTIAFYKEMAHNKHHSIT